MIILFFVNILSPVSDAGGLQGFFLFWKGRNRFFVNSIKKKGFNKLVLNCGQATGDCPLVLGGQLQQMVGS